MTALADTITPRHTGETLVAATGATLADRMLRLGHASHAQMLNASRFDALPN